MTGTSVTSNSMTRLSPAPPMLRLRTSSNPLPAAPPLGSLLPASAPAGTETTFSVPAWNIGDAFRLSSSSTTLKLLIGVSLVFSMYRR